MCIYLKSGMCIYLKSEIWIYLKSGICIYLISGMCIYLNSGMCIYLKSGMCIYLKSWMCIYLKSGIYLKSAVKQWWVVTLYNSFYVCILQFNFHYMYTVIHELIICWYWLYYLFVYANKVSELSAVWFLSCRKNHTWYIN